MAVQVARIKLGRVFLDMEALGPILDKVGENPVAVIAVSGPLQNGKSNIANHLLSKLSFPMDIAGDPWKTTRANQILMWPEPLVAGSTPVLLISVHGSQDGNLTIENALTDAFGRLLASVTIYHVKGGLPEGVLQYLLMTIMIAKTVSQQEIAQLLFAVNDWQMPSDYAFGVHDDSGGPSARNFKGKLSVLTGILPEHRVVRQEILSGFQESCCCLMPPFQDETVEGPAQLQDMANWIFGRGRCITKTVQGQEVTGTRLKALVQEWAKSLVVSNIPALRMAVEGPGEVANAACLSVALQFFKTEVSSAANGPNRLTGAQLGQILDRKKREAVAMFERMTITQHEAVYQRYVAILEDSLNEVSRPEAMGNRSRRPAMADPVRIQVATPSLAQRMCPEMDSEHWRCICWFVLLLHALIGGGVVLWLSYRHLGSSAEGKH